MAPTPKDPKEVTAASDNVDPVIEPVTDGPDVAGPESKRARLDRIKAELAEAEAEAAGDPEAATPDKILVLLGGELVETSGAVPTHHSTEVGGYALPVIGVLPHPDHVTL